MSPRNLSTLDELNMNTAMSKKRPLTGNFSAEIFEPRFNTSINIIDNCPGSAVCLRFFETQLYNR